MDEHERHRRAEGVLHGYEHGADAPLRATAAALAAAAEARTVVLVEGISDQMALEALAGRLERDLVAERVVVVPIGGAHAISRYADRFDPATTGLTVVGLCDAAEEPVVRRALGPALFVCVEDLEDELIRATGRELFETVLAEQGDLESWRTLQRQPAWRHGDFRDQARRWLGAGAGRKLRYASVLTLAIPPDRLPEPLTSLLAATENVASRSAVARGQARHVNVDPVTRRFPSS